MKLIRVTVTAAAVALTGVVAADAGPSEGGQTENERLLSAAVAAANAFCGSAIAVQLADSGPAVEPTLRDNITQSCRHAFDGIRMACMTQAGRAAVSARIKRVGCGLSGPGVSLTGGSAVSLDREGLDYRIEPGRVLINDGHMVFRHLLDKLEVEGQPLFVQVLKPMEEEALAREVAKTNRQCGSSITVEFDWTGVSASEVRSRSPSNYCGHAIDVVARVCADGAGKEAVAKRIKRIVCGYARERSILLEDDVLKFKSDFQSSADRRSFILEYLQNAL
jgi:hypothetical protein